MCPLKRSAADRSGFIPALGSCKAQMIGEEWSQDSEWWRTAKSSLVSLSVSVSRWFPRCKGTPSASLSPSEILKVLSALFASRGHGRAASLGTASAHMGPEAADLEEQQTEREHASTGSSQTAQPCGTALSKSNNMMS